MHDSPDNVTPENPLRRPGTLAAKKGGLMKASPKKWIQGAVKKAGALRETLGAKKGQPIPKAKLAAAAKQPGKTGQRARLAQTLGKMNKSKKYADGGAVMTGRARVNPLMGPRISPVSTAPANPTAGSRLSNLVANQRSRMAQFATQTRTPAAPTPAPTTPTPTPSAPSGAFSPEQLQQLQQFIQTNSQPQPPPPNPSADWQSMGNKRGGLIRAKGKAARPVKKRG